MRLPSSGFNYVHVELDRTVRELDSDEQEYLKEVFHPNDGARPYIKSNYWQKTPDGKIDGFLKRIRVPWWIEIDSNTAQRFSQFDITKFTNKVSFNNEEDYETHPSSEISCPKCSSRTARNFSDLKKHQHSDFSNLKETDKFELTLFSQGLPEQTDSFLDYYCSNCGAGLRILYESWAGGKHGEQGYELKYIVTA